MKLCLGCAAFPAPEVFERCDICGAALVDDTPEHRARWLDALAHRRIHDWLDDWHAQGIIAARVAKRLHVWIDAQAKPLHSAPPTVMELPPPTEPLVAPPTDMESPPTALLVAPPASLPPASPSPQAVPYNAASALDVPAPAAEVFHAGDAAHGALDALVSFDAPTKPEAPSRWETELRPLLYENIGWFIGTLFVLSGSVYGVREAWRSLGGVARHLVVAGAFLAYHLGFVGVARLLAPRSATTGRVLGGIALALLPVVFAALSSLVALSVPVGTVTAIAALAIADYSTRSVDRRFDEAAAFSAALLPTLALALPVASLAPDSWGRVALGLLGIASLAWNASTALPDAPPAPDAPLSLRRPLAALYGLAALVAFACFGASDAGSDLTRLATGYAFVGASLAAVLALLAPRASLVAAHPRAAVSLDVVALAASAASALAATMASWTSPSAWLVSGVAASATAALTTTSFALATERHGAAAHAIVPAATTAVALAARVLLRRNDVAATAVTMLAPCVALLVARSVAAVRTKTVLSRWATLAGFAVLAATALQELFTATTNAPLTVTTGTAIAFAAALHVAGGFEAPRLHLAGGLALALGTALSTLPGVGDRAAVTALAFAALGSAYGVAAIAWERAATKRGFSSEFHPLDDLARFAPGIGLLIGWGNAGPAGSFMPPSLDEAERLRALAVVVPGVVFAARSLRDRSRFVAFVGLVAVGRGLCLAAGASSLAERAITTGVLTLMAALVATGIGRMRRGVGLVASSRRVLGTFRLPWRGKGLALVRDAFADAALFGALVTATHVLRWTASWDALTRPLTVSGGAALVVSLLVAFVSPGFVARRMRGHAFTLASVLLTATLAAVANRVGRPLPPSAVSVRLTVVAVLLWGLRQALATWGDRLATSLGVPSQGRAYPKVFSVAVVAVACALVADAALVAWPTLDRALIVTPAMMFVGAAVALLLMARATGATAWTALALGLVTVGATLAAAQGTLLGPPLVRAPSGCWVTEHSPALSDLWRCGDATALVQGTTVDLVRQRALTGLAWTATLWAALAAWIARREADATAALRRLFGAELSEAPEALRTQLSAWSAVAGTLVLIASAWRGHLVADVAVTFAGALLVTARVHTAGVLLGALGAVATLHAHAATSATTPWYIGPAVAVLANAAVLTGPAVVRRYRVDAGAVYARTHALAALLGALAFVDALATGGAWTSGWSLLDILWNAFTALGGRWMGAVALPLVFALGATGFGLAARQRASIEERDDAHRLAASAVMLASFAAWTGCTIALVLSSRDTVEPWALPFARGLLALRVLGTPFVLLSSVVALAAHVVARSRTSTDDGLVAGLRWGRDAQLVAAVLWAAVFAGLSRTAGAAAPTWALTTGVAGFALGVVVAGHAAWREATPRHVYFIQTAIVAVYGLVRAELATGLPAEADAVFALVMAFLLVGVTVQARRAGIPPVAVATRRFAALLPIGVALVLPTEASTTTALAAAASALLYATLGWVERSRLFGSLGAAAGNLALLLFALSNGLRGVEVGLVPFGLFVMALSQLFTDSLARSARASLRVLGGLLVYLPAAVQVALQVGNARDGMYPVLFGAVCLAGVAAGMLMHIRAYLALGVGFLVLDVVASLTHAGLRDHRVGFVLLSSAGLAILAGMVFVTLRRDAVRAWRARWTARLRTWE